MAVKSGKGSKLWSFEFLLVPRKCVTASVRATSSRRGRSDWPIPPRTPLLHTTHLHIGIGFFISTCHNKVDDGRYSSQLVMFCLAGGFSWGGISDSGCHLWSTIWGLLYFPNSGKRATPSRWPNLANGCGWYFFILYMLISSQWWAFFSLRLVFAFVRGLKPPKNTIFLFLGQKSWFLDFQALCGENSQP